jgi:hypothetical protein
VESRGRDLEVRIRQHRSGAFEVRPDTAVDPRGGGVVRQYGDGRQDTLFDVLQVACGIRGAVSAAEQLANHDRARELVCARNGLQPIDVGGGWPRLQYLGEGIGVEEVGHALPVTSR